MPKKRKTGPKPKKFATTLLQKSLERLENVSISPASPRTSEEPAVQFPDIIISSIDNTMLNSVLNKLRDGGKVDKADWPTVDSIAGALERGDMLVLCIKFVEDEQVYAVPACLANLVWPQEVIKFYEQRVTLFKL